MTERRTLHVGIDDTDSTERGCTTYVAALLVEQLEKLGSHFIDYPNLIRLNPNVPWKTRGNGALCLRMTHDEAVTDRIKEIVISTVEKQSDLDNRGTDPGIVFFSRKTIPRQIGAFAKRTITGVVDKREALGHLKKFHGEAVAFKNGRGVIGALAAVGETLRSDHTYEVIAYRTPENCGSKRKVGVASVFEMDKATKPFTFNNVDTDKKRVIVTPRGPDPILFGIRGETPQVVKKALQMVKADEPIERWVIFRTNQGTDAHLKHVKSLGEIKAYKPIIARGIVSTDPRMIRGRHMIFSVKDTSSEVDCAAYEPTGALKTAVKHLVIGDRIELCGGARPPSAATPLTVNLEKIRLLKLAPKTTCRNPLCPRCGKRLKSMGAKKGFRCEKCHGRYRSMQKVQTMLPRAIQKGLYITSTRSQRHLTKPFARYGMEKRREKAQGLIDGWHFP